MEHDNDFWRAHWSLTVQQLAFFNQQPYQICKHNSTKQSKYWTERKKITEHNKSRRIACLNITNISTKRKRISLWENERFVYLKNRSLSNTWKQPIFLILHWTKPSFRQLEVFFYAAHVSRWQYKKFSLSQDWLKVVLLFLIVQTETVVAL